MHAPHALSRLLRVPSPEAMATLDAVSRALDTTDDRDALEALAAAMPQRVVGLAPEVSVALAGLAVRFAPYGVRYPVDAAELTDLPRIEWLRAGVILGRAAPPAGDLRRVIAGWSVDAIPTPLPILRALAIAEDPALRLVCLDWLPAALTGMGVGVGEAFDLACGLAEDRAWQVSARALASGVFGARFGLSLQQRARREDAVLAGLHRSDAEIVRVALQTCAILGRRDWLRDFADDADRPVHLRAQALAAVGALAEPADLPWALELAQTPGMEEACRRCLLDAHRKGAFLSIEALDAVLTQYDTNTGWTPTDLIRVTHLVRDALIARLAIMPPEDRRWIRRADLLAESGVEAAPRLLERLLNTVEDPRVGMALIEAAACSPGFADADALIRWLDVLPGAALCALRFTRCTPAQRGAIAAFAQAPTVDTPTHEMARRAHRAWAGVGGALEVVADALPLSASRAPTHFERLETACASRARSALPEVTAAFRDCVTDSVRRALAGDFSVKRVELPTIEQQVYRYGRRLLADHLTLRPWRSDTEETARDLLLALICDWLDEGPARAITVALLEMAARHAPTGHWLRRIEGLWRHGDRAVQRAAVDAILSAGEAAAGLALSLSRLVESRSPRVAERGLEAIQTFGARWAEPLALRALSRPEMAVKQAAAAALRVVASAAAVPTILDWLARHDNRSLRQALTAAFETAAGPARPALLIAAYEAEADPRRRGLLLDALSGLLPLAGLLRLRQTQRPSADALVDAALDGRMRLADASQAQVEARLHRLRVREAPTSGGPADELRLRGFTAERAQAVLAAWTETRDRRCVVAVGQRLVEWLAWCPDDAAAELALRSAGRQHAELIDALLGLAPRVQTEIALPFIQRCVVDPSPAQRQTAIDLLRSLPDAPEPGGWARFERLQALDAVVTRDDLWRCLEECARGPDFARRSAALLRSALQLSRPDGHGRSRDAAPEVAPVTRRLVEGAAEWHRMPDADRPGWLDDALSVRPLGVPPLKDAPAARERSPQSTADLVAALGDPDVDVRDAAAQALAESPTATRIWPGLLKRALAGEIEAPECVHGQLAEALVDWPTEPAAQDIAMAWIDRLDRAQLRMFIPDWIARRARGDARAEACLRATDDGPLLPFVWAGKAEDPTLARLLSTFDQDAPGMQALVAWLKVHAPDEATRFKRPETEPIEAPVAVDPMADLDLAGLRALIGAAETPDGLAVRAVHALTASGDAAIEPLAGLALDERSKVRSAALRALRRVAPRPRSLDVTCDVLRIEDRHDVILQLMRSLGHGRHQPALPLLIDRLVHRKGRIAEGARDALIGFGEAALPALQHAARRARPDRRDAYRAVIAAIEG